MLDSNDFGEMSENPSLMISKDEAMEIAEENLAEAIKPLVTSLEAQVSKWLGPPNTIWIKTSDQNIAVIQMFIQLCEEQGWTINSDTSGYLKLS